jgi:hypothetical protein
VTTPADELRAAAFQLRNPFHLPGLRLSIDPELAHPLADLLDKWAWMGELTPDVLNRIGGPETLAIARAINQETT